VILVNIWCKHPDCRKLLGWVEFGDLPASEAAWGYYSLRVPLCPKHGEGAGYGNIMHWQERQRRAGKPADRVQTHRYMQWAELRPAVEEARRTGIVQEYRI
jgi:hypothetical protein